ncbi:hypothetical protein D3C72_1209350 [compost metagenome]
MIAHAAQKAAESGENIARAIKNASQFFTMKNYMQQSFASTMFIGIIISLTISLLIRKKSKWWQD